jgi:hypothetical protein
MFINACVVHGTYIHMQYIYIRNKNIYCFYSKRKINMSNVPFLLELVDALHYALIMIGF